MRSNIYLNRSEKIEFLNGIKAGTTTIDQVIPQLVEVWEVGENCYTNKRNGKSVISNKFDLIKKEAKKMNGLLLVVGPGKLLTIFGKCRPGGRFDDVTYYTLLEACNNGYEIEHLNFTRGHA